MIFKKSDDFTRSDLYQCVTSAKHGIWGLDKKTVLSPCLSRMPISARNVGPGNCTLVMSLLIPDVAMFDDRGTTMIGKLTLRMGNKP